MAIPDPIQAIVAFLQADAQVAALAGTRVFSVELPAPEAAFMPRGAVVITGSGSARMVRGLGTSDFIPAGNRRIDVRCYGATTYDATALDLAVYEALKHMNRVVVGNAMLYTATIESTGINMRDADGKWPLSLSVYVVTVSEIAVATP